jgi:hypothetical protein
LRYIYNKEEKRRFVGLAERLFFDKPIREKKGGKKSAQKEKGISVQNVES